MNTGNVKWFDVKKGFGFIVGPEGQDVFVHFSSITGDGFKTLKDGEPVEYVLQQGDKGWHAREVRRVQPRTGDGAPQMDGHSPPARLAHLERHPAIGQDGESMDGASARASTSASR